MSQLQMTQLMHAATKAYQSGDLVVAEANARKVHRKDRRNLEALALLGQIAHRRGQYREAAGCFKKCITLRPKESAGYVLLGFTYLRFGKVKAAIGQFDKAMRIAPDDLRIYAAKADALLINGDHDLTRTYLEGEIAAGRVSPELAAARAQLAIAERDFATAVETGAPWLEDEDVPPTVRYRIGSMVGKAHERLGAHDAALRAWTLGNEAVRVPYEPEMLGRLIDELIEAYSRERFEKLARRPSGGAGLVFIVGPPRSGTTLLERILDSHPDVLGIGESRVLVDLIADIGLRIRSTLPYPACMADADDEDVERLGAGLESSARALAPGAAFVAEKNLGNIRHLGLITQLLPEATLVHARRDPVDTGLSCFAEPLDVTEHPWCTDLAMIGDALARFERLMRHWQDALGIELVTVDYADLVANQEEETRRLLDACGIAWNDACLDFHEAGARKLTLSHEQVRKPMYRTSVDRAAAFGAGLDPLRRVIDAEWPS